MKTNTENLMTVEEAKALESSEARQNKEKVRMFRKREQESKATIKRPSKEYSYCAACGWLNGFATWVYADTKEEAGKNLVNKLDEEIAFLKRRKSEVREIVKKEQDRKKRVKIKQRKAAK